MTDTSLEAWLAERKAVHSKATEGPWEADGTEISQHWSRPEPWAVVASNEIACMAFCYGGSARGIEHEEDANAAVDAFNHLPALVAMVEVVLKRHRPADVHVWLANCADPENHQEFPDPRTGDSLCENEPIGRFCSGCAPDSLVEIDVDEFPWPCAELRALEAARKAVSGR